MAALKWVLARVTLFRNRAPTPLGVALLYGLFAGLWIGLSDRLLGVLPLTTEQMLTLSTLKGGLFVLASSLLLFLLLRTSLRPGSDDGRRPAIGKSGTRLMLLLLGVALSLPLLSFGIVQLHKPQLESESQKNLTAIAAFKSEQVEEWLRNRHGSSRIMMRNALVREQAALAIQTRATDFPPSLRDYLLAVQAHYRYDNIELVDAKGRQVAALHPAPPLDSRVRALLGSARPGTVLRSEPYADPRGQLHLNFIVPLHSAARTGATVIGALILHTDPAQTLLPFIGTWPNASTSGEILLLREQEEQRVYLNLMPQASDGPLSHQLMLATASLPAAIALNPRQAGTTRGQDYMGKAVLAAYQPVAGTDWILIAKQDSDEILAPLRSLILWVSLVSVFAILVVTAVVLLFWRQQGRAHQLELLAQAAEKDKLLHHFYSLPFIGMALIEPLSGRWLQCNDKLAAMLGYTPEELAHLSWLHLFHPEERDAERHRYQRLLNGHLPGYQLESRLLHKQGYPMEVSLALRAVATDDGHPEYLVAMLKDIGARKRSERALRRQQALYDCLSQTNQTILHTPDRDELFANVCRIAVEHGGFRYAWIGLLDEQGQHLQPVSRHGDDEQPLSYAEQLNISAQPDNPRGQGLSGRALRSGQPCVSNDLRADPRSAPWHDLLHRAGVCSGGAFPIHQGGQVIGTLSLYSCERGFFSAAVLATLQEMAQDVSFALDNLTRETELRESEQRFRLAIREAPIPIMMHAEDGRVLALSQTWCRLSGYSEAELPDLDSWTRLAYGAEHAQARALIRSVYTAPEHKLHIEKEVHCQDGRNRHWEFNAVPLGRLLDGRQIAITMASDITERKQAEEALRESEALFHTLANVAPVGIFRTDAAGHCRYINARGAAIAGLASPALAQTCWLDSIHPEDRAEVSSLWLQALTSAAPFQHEFRFLHASGIDLWVRGTAEPEFDEQGRLSGYVGTLTDISDIKAKELELRLAATVFENTREGILVTDREQRILMVNPALSELLGYSQAQMLGQTPALFRSGHHDRDFYLALWHALNTTGHWRGEIWNRRQDGELRPELVSINAIHDQAGAVLNYVSVHTDIAQIKASEAKLEYLAKHDPLTGLPNRFLLNARLQHALQQAERQQTRLALLVLDLDRFKDINDSFGHAMGDALLQQVASRLSERLRHSDTICRLGGDEFTLLLEGNPGIDAVARVAEQIIDTLARPLALPNGREVVIGASIGISLYPEHGQDPDALLQQADAALYHAKAEGRACFRFFSDELTRSAQARLALEGQLRQALARNELSLHYQPLTDIQSGAITGAEALLRWHNPQEGMVPPDRFIPLAEETGLIGPIGEWVLGEACRQGQRWRQAGLPDLNLSVNLSTRQLRHGDLAATVTQILAQTGFPATALTLEITESALMAREQEAAVMLARLRTLGVRIAIDDFGTGYSSLAYLKRLPLDVLKIDKRFVDDISHDQHGREIAATVIAMGHNLGLKVLAEGVETEAQLAFLRHQGCDGYQGYLMSRPLPAPAFQQLLTERG